MGQLVTAVCICKDSSEDNLVNAEGKNYFTLMTPGWIVIHIILLFVTVSFWVGWMGVSWLLKGTVYVCAECESEIDKTNLRIGGKTKNVFVQNTEMKKINDSNNKKSEVGFSSVEKRLEDILNLKVKGLISDDEYQIKKKEILKDM